MSRTFDEIHDAVCSEPTCYKAYTDDSYPGWQEDNGTYTLFLFGWDDRQLIYNWGPFPTNESPSSTCCEASTGNRYDSPVIQGCGGVPMYPGCFGCNEQPGVE